MNLMLKHKYLILRRVLQIGVLACFAFGASLFVQGNLSSSLWFSAVPLSDPYAVLQLLCAGLAISAGALSGSVLLGALLILAFYGLFAGRAFCAWVCPVNLIVDFAAFVRKKLEIQGSTLILSKNVRYYLLALSLLLSFVLATPAFESISYIGIIQRGVIFGTISWLMVAFIIFVVDTFLSPKALCSHLCPLGAFYALAGHFALLKVKYDFAKCSKCFNCVSICPEKQVLSMIGKQSGRVNSGECIRCGRCVEVCNDDALNFSILNLQGEKNDK